ncbi:hypothetical protein J6590_094303 [Homalodisca vitripennis]|nr:hypothetical protein J6590_094303 [Homalodisca vitripennis]
MYSIRGEMHCSWCGVTMTANNGPRISLGTSDNSVTTMAACVQYELLTVPAVCDSNHRAVDIAILCTASDDN